jgi:hypothetical protein
MRPKPRGVLQVVIDAREREVLAGEHRVDDALPRLRNVLREQHLHFGGREQFDGRGLRVDVEGRRGPEPLNLTMFARGEGVVATSEKNFPSSTSRRACFTRSPGGSR